MQSQSRIRHTNRPPLNATGMGLSAACATHCVVAPFVLGALPVSTWLAGSFLHWSLGLATIVVAASAFISGVHRHRDWSVLLTGGIGCLVLAVVSIFGVRWLPNSEFSNVYRILFMSFGSLCLIVAHFANVLGHRACDTRQRQKGIRSSI